MRPLLDRPKDCITLARSHKERDKLIRAILQDEHYNGWVKRFIKRNGGHNSDIVTVTNDSILNFLKICLREDFEVENVRAYLIGSSKFIWYQLFKKQRMYSQLKYMAETSDKEKITTDLISEEKKTILSKLLDLAGEDCKQVLTLWSYNFKMKSIATELNLSSEGYAKKKKHVCLKKLITIVNEHPHLIKELKSYG